MNIENLLKPIAEAPEFDPRADATAGGRSVAASFMRSLPPESHNQIIGAALIDYARDAAAAISAGRYGDIKHQLVADLRNKISSKIALEREHGMLRPWSAAYAMKPFIGIFSERRWNGYECSQGQQLLPSGSRIVEVTFREWKLDQGRAITRADVRAFAESQRPAWARTLGDSGYFERNFTPEIAIKEAEAAELRRESKSREISAGPRHLIGTLAE
jgi:hypothetical protein